MKPAHPQAGGSHRRRRLVENAASREAVVKYTLNLEKRT
jgi:hypothetical protein